MTVAIDLYVNVKSSGDVLNAYQLTLKGETMVCIP